MKSLLTVLDGKHRTPVGVGLVLLAVNVSLIVAFGLSITFIVLLGQVGINIPPWIVVAAFGLAALFLGFGLAMAMPASFSAVNILVSVLIGAAPVVLATTAEYAYLLLDPEGCVGGHIVILLLGSLSLGAMAVMTACGLLVRRRMRRA